VLFQIKIVTFTANPSQLLFNRHF